MPEKLFAGLLCDVTGRDCNSLDAMLVTDFGYIDSVFQEDHRVVVGKCDAVATRLDGGFRDRPWRSAVLQPVELTGF